MFTSGRIAFALIFIIVFALGLFWAYRKDIKKSPWYFKGSLKIVAILVSIYLIYYIIVRHIL